MTSYGTMSMSTPLPPAMAGAINIGNGARSEHTTTHETPRTVTSPPLRDDFDAFTTTQTQTHKTQRWSSTTRAATPAVVALRDQLEAMTATRATTPMGDELPAGKRRTRHGAVDDPIAARPLRRKKRIKPISPAEDRGLDFTLVTHRVLEDGPERTVSLSTWREQAVEEEIGGDAMSVYYVRPEDLDWGWGDGIPMAAREEIVIVPFPVEAPWKVDEKDTSPSSESGEGSAPHTSTPRGSGNTLVPPAGEFHPFQATRSKSGSIISSIHLTPQPLPLHPPSPPPPPADETLSDILATCEPPLTHLEPVLARVGILRTAHLHAVGRLSDAPRAEVRDAALKLGVTVLEWAMLLDRIRAL